MDSSEKGNFPGSELAEESDDGQVRAEHGRSPRWCSRRWATRASAHASAFGLTGHLASRERSATRCHSGGTAPTVAFSGPDTVAVGATVTYHFSVESARAAQRRAAGFNVAVMAANWPSFPIRASNCSAASSRTRPRSPTPTTWRAGTSRGRRRAPPARRRLFGAGNSVNLNGLNSGDRASATTFVVSGGRGGHADADRHPGAALAQRDGGRATTPPRAARAPATATATAPCR